MLKENSRAVLDYVMTHEDENVTAKTIAEALGLSAQTVNGIVTAAFQRKKFMVRVPSEEDEKVKYIKMTPEGRAHDFDAEDAE